MISSDDGKVILKGKTVDILTDYTVLTKALLNEFDLDFILTAVAVAVHHEMAPSNKVDMSDLHNLLKQLGNESEDSL